jgi:hypothetical protein
MAVMRHEISSIDGVMSLEAFLSAILGAVLGGVIAFGIAFIVEMYRRPKLILSRLAPIDTLFAPIIGTASQTACKSLHIDVYNKPFLGFRAAALQCKAEITFYELDGRDRFGKSMIGRWSSSPQPLPIKGRILPEGKEFLIEDPSRLTLESRTDIFPGERKELDLVLRFQGEENCYGWNNDQFFKLDNKNNLDWPLEHHRYLVQVRIFTFGQSFTGIFEIVNNVPYSSFRLADATPEDRRLLKR